MGGYCQSTNTCQTLTVTVESGNRFNGFVAPQRMAASMIGQSNESKGGDVEHMLDALVVDGGCLKVVAPNGGGIQIGFLSRYSATVV